MDIKDISEQSYKNGYTKGYEQGKKEAVAKNTITTNYDRIRNMSVEGLARFLAEHIDHYRAPYEVKELYANAIDNKTGKGIIWIEAFKRWLESEVDTE